MTEEIPDGIHQTQVSKLLKGKKDVKIAEMIHETSQDLSDKRIVFRLSLAEKDEKGREIFPYSAFTVKPYESAILFQLGQYAGIVPEGLWEIDKQYIHSSSEIIWIDNTEFKTRWGITDVYLSDKIKIGAYGSLLVKISNPKDFVLNVVSSKQIVEKEQVDKFIFDLVVQSYKDVLGNLTIDDVIRSRDDIKEKVYWKLNDFLTHWGIKLINLEIEGFKLPEEYEELGRIAMTTVVKKAEKASERELIQEDIETVKIKIELEKEKQIYEDSKVLYERLGFSEFSTLMEELQEFRQEMHERFDSLEDMLGDVVDIIPNGEDFLGAIYGGDAFEEYLKNNKDVLKAIKKLTKKTKKTDNMMKLLIEKTIEKELEYDINLEGGTEDKGIYHVGKPFNAEIKLKPKLKTYIHKITSTLTVINAWFGEEEKEITEKGIIIDEKITPGVEYIIEIEIEKPLEKTSLLLETSGQTKIHGKKYPISLITDPIDVMSGKIKWVKIKKVLKKGIKFAAPQLSKRVSYLFED